MEKLLDTKIRDKSYLRSVGVIMDMIAEGKLQYGDQLYKEQELAEMLGVSRPTMREALRVLEFLGIASAVPHKGISISRPSETGGYLPLLYILAFEKTTGKELFELRQAMQLEMVAVAADNATKDDVAALYELISQMEAQLPDDDAFARLDDEFHRKLLEISGNRLIYKLMETIRPMIRNQLNERARMMSVEARGRTVMAHRLIVEFVERGDGNGARQAMYLHLTGSRLSAGNEPVKFK